MPMIAWTQTSTNSNTERRAWVDFRRRPHRGDHVHQRQRKQHVGADPVDELHGLRVLEDIDPPGVLQEKIGRDPRAIHQRPGIVAEARIEPGNQRAEIDLEQAHDCDDGGHPTRTIRRRRIIGMRTKAALDPHAGGEDQTGDDEVGRQPVLTDFGPLHQTGRNHPPADKTLEATERQNAEQRPAQPAFDPTRQPEEGERHGEDDADGARQQPVRPFPPEDRLELADGHAVVELLVLRNALVELELLLPLLGRQRRDHTVDRFPLRDRKAGFGQARRAADKHQRKKRKENDDEPAADLPAVAIGPANLASEHLFCRQFDACHGFPSGIAGLAASGSSPRLPESR